ncbi:hypothetical protein UF29_00095, partial [Vibrio parahaemolyticus]
MEGKEQEGEKGKDYFTLIEPLSKVPSHRALARLRGRNEGFLALAMNADPEQEVGARQSHCETIIADHYCVTLSNARADAGRKLDISWAWMIKESMPIDNWLMAAIKGHAEIEANEVFAT